jgi:hypothetical protein
MGKYSNAQGNFLGGYWSQEAYGRVDDPNYKFALRECLNAYPVEGGSWKRRPGWRSIGYTHRGRPAKLYGIGGEQTVQYNAELTEGNLRIANGMSLLTDGNLKNVTNISTDNPCVITTDVPHEWNTGDTVAVAFQTKTSQFACAIISNRVMLIEKVDANNFKLHDYITEKGVDGSTVAWDSSFVVTVAKVLVLSSPYTNGRWQTARHIPTDSVVYFLHSTLPMQQLTMVEAGPTSMQQASLAAAEFVDGPYYDPVEGSIATPDALSGVVNLTFSFAVWASTTAYATGDVAAYNGIYYISTQDNNVNNAPAVGSLYWTTTSPTGFVNQGLGFLPTDVGRHVRLLSEPPAWNTATSYTAGQVVRFDINGNTTYWAALKSMTGATPAAGSINPNQPGADPTTWVANATGAIWTWGKITANYTGNKVAFVGTPIGNLTGQAGLASMEGSTILSETAASEHDGKTAFVGFQFNSATKVSSARLFPASRATAGNPVGGGGLIQAGISSKPGPFNGNVFLGLGPNPEWGTGSGLAQPPSAGGINTEATDFTFMKGAQANVRVTLYASNSLITAGNILSATKLGQVSLSTSELQTGGVLISSNDNTTTWFYVAFYIEIFPTQNMTTRNNSYSAAYANPKIVASYMEFYDETQHAGSKVAVQILGDPLLYTSAIRTWRVGRFNASEPTWPHTGCFRAGRVFLASGNGHFDAGKAGQGLIFSPTYPDGSVADDSAISYDFNETVKGKILWMAPGEDGVTCGTSAGEFLISAPSAKNSIAPTDIDAPLVTEFGAADVEPTRAPHALLFVHQNTRDVQEYMRDLYSGKLVASLLTARSHSLSKGGITQVAFQKSTDSILWATTAQGALIGTTYRRDTRLAFSPPTYNGWHRHNHGAGRDFLSVSMAPSRRTGLDAPIAVTQSPGTGLCRLEVQGDQFEDDATIWDAAFLDGQMVQITGVMGGAPGTGEAPPPPPPPPPPPSGWVLTGWHLTLQCSAVSCVSPPSHTHMSPVLGQSTTYLTAPSTMAFGSCGFPGFSSVPQVPGYDSFLPGPNANSFSICQFVANPAAPPNPQVYHWTVYQEWEADDLAHPAPIGSGPVYNP